MPGGRAEALKYCKGDFVMNKFLKKLGKNFVEACEAYYYVYGQH